ncbi:Putative beta-glucosidase A [Hirsutella minnesotensis 3608]|uniref:beta-glucosidase n=1 Tax=Hirsutella minnesotensis 3608 TaxID=1043627 RepID=A0A0F7ZUJ0_9HYPO|nr:Putative beta-glucosidase A [Hirsutella minnesotensis 3608]
MKPLTVAAALQLALADAQVVAPANPEQNAQPNAQPRLAFSPPHYPSPWMDPQADGWEAAYAKAKEFVSQLTLPEKVNLTTGIGWMGGNCVGNTGSVPRLGLHSLCLQDGPLGLRFSDYNSAFPVGVTAAASWSKHLWNARGKAMGQEARGKGVDVLLGPVSGPIGRAPEGGRNAEGFGSDPYLQGQGLARTSEGIEQAGVIACAKHYVANEQEHFRQSGEAKGYGVNIDEALSSNVDDKTMHEVYAWPFVDAVKAGVGSIMCSYNQINNSYGCQNSRLLNGILKGEMGFQGFVMSDWQAQHSGIASAVAGLDMTMPGDTVFNSGKSFWGGNLTLGAINGTLPVWRLDDMAMRIMAAYFKAGKTIENQIETNFNSWTRDSYGHSDAAAKENWQRINKQVDVRADHANHIRESAAKGTVILKNTGSLPLQRPKFLAVIGEDAGPNPKGPNGCPDRGCDDGTLAMIWGSGTSNFPYLVTPDSALQRQAVQDGTRYENVLSNYAWEQTQALVSQPNATAVVFANAASGEGYITVDGNIGDRKNLTLWKNGDDLIKNVSAINPNTIVVIHSVGPVILTDWYNNPNITAIVWAGQPGQESGNSLTDILYGKSSPGRSPFTWGPSRESYGTDVLYEANNGNGAPQSDFTEGVFIDYRHFDKVAPGKAGQPGAPLYEFGFGLSWSTFKYSNLRIEKHNVAGYQPAVGDTEQAPTFGEFSRNMDDHSFPAGIRYVNQWIYPWLNSTSSGLEASADPEYGQTAEEFLPQGATDGKPQHRLPASGACGGNRQLWDIMYTVTCQITNTGKRMTDEIPQVYVSLGGENEPVRVLRGFERIERIEPGKTVTFRADLTRRDLSNWDVVAQNWVITKYPKKVWVGSSSRNLPLQAELV